MRIVSTASGLTVHTPAKLNLFLEILGKRSDGFHELETVMVSVDLYDTLIFREDTSGSIQFELQFPRSSGGKRTLSSSSDIPTGQDNLVVRAAELLREFAGKDTGTRIVLTKRIPSAAGLAGGSSDAAATLVGLNRLWNTGLTVPELQDLAARLGSDPGFFIPSVEAAVCRGRGERVEPVTTNGCLHFVIARPSSGLSTADVFRHCVASTTPRTADRLINALGRGCASSIARLMHNQLQSPAEELNPDVSHLLKIFRQQSMIGHQMSGSGTACFGICHDKRHAMRTAAMLRSQGIDSVFVTRMRT